MALLFFSSVARLYLMSAADSHRRTFSVAFGSVELLVQMSALHLFSSGSFGFSFDCLVQSSALGPF